MKDTERSELRAGKGTRIPVTEGILGKLVEALTQAQELYIAAEEPKDFMAALELDGESNTKYERGNRQYAAHNKFLIIQTGSGEQFRMTFSLTEQGGFTLDFRGWYTPKGMG